MRPVCAHIILEVHPWCSGIFGTTVHTDSLVSLSHLLQGPWTQGTTNCRIACCLPSWSFEAHLSLPGFVTLSSALSVYSWLGLFKHCAVPLDLVLPKASSAVFLSSKSSVIFLVYPILLGWVGPGPTRPWDKIKGCGNTKAGDQKEDGFMK